MLDEYREMQEELERLRRNKKESDEAIKRLSKERSFLRKNARDVQVKAEQRSGESFKATASSGSPSVQVGCLLLTAFAGITP